MLKILVTTGHFPRKPIYVAMKFDSLEAQALAYTMLGLELIGSFPPITYEAYVMLAEDSPESMPTVLLVMPMAFLAAQSVKERLHRRLEQGNFEISEARMSQSRYNAYRRVIASVNPLIAAHLYIRWAFYIQNVTIPPHQVPPNKTLGK